MKKKYWSSSSNVQYTKTHLGGQEVYGDRKYVSATSSHVVLEKDVGTDSWINKLTDSCKRSREIS